MATNTTIILAKRAAGPADMPIPNAAYDGMEKKSVSTAGETSLVASSDDQFWFVTPTDADIRVLEIAHNGTAVTTTTGWLVKAGTRWEAKATNGKTLSLILDA